MPPKKKKSKEKRMKKEPILEIDYASDQYFKPSEPIVYVEMDRQCFVFKEQLDVFETIMKSKFPQTIFHIVTNPTKIVGELGPRHGSFEIWFAQNGRCPEELLWSGVNKGPPRKLKFSNNEYEDLWPQIKKILGRFYKLEEIDEEDVDNQ